MLTIVSTSPELFANLGYFTLPVNCFTEPPASRLLRPVDEVFAHDLKENMLKNPSKDVTPLVGLVVLGDGEEFDEQRKESYMYETLGGNNSRVALQELVKESDDPRFRMRLASVYRGLTDDQALRLAAKHNAVTSLHHAISTSDKVGVSR